MTAADTMMVHKENKHIHSRPLADNYGGDCTDTGEAGNGVGRFRYLTRYLVSYLTN